MSGNDPTIDMMELADLGQPRKIAWEIHRQLRTQYGEVPRHIPLSGIAKAVGIVSIDEFDTNSFEGTLVIQGAKGAIGLRRGLQRGRRNFTLGHELGHFLNPWHRKFGSKFECNKHAVLATRSPDFSKRPIAERIEVEANEFSAALLVPLPEYKIERKLLGKDIDITHIRALAITFAVSQEFMARIYVDQADSKIAVIHSQDGVVRRLILPSDFPYLGLRKDVPLPRESLTHKFRITNPTGAVSTLNEISTSAWLERRGSVTALYEQVLLQKEGWTTTLLMIDEDEEDDEADDSNWNRRNFRR